MPRQVAVESKHYSYGDWPLEGPATVHHMIRHTQKYGGDPRLWLQVWARQKQSADNDRVMHELRCLTDMIYYGGSFDQLNMPVLVSFEIAARRMASIVDASQAGGHSNPDWSNAKIFAGHQGREDLVMPSLKSWAARRGREEAEIFQARNKMRELARGHGRVHCGACQDLRRQHQWPHPQARPPKVDLQEGVPLR